MRILSTKLTQAAAAFEASYHEAKPTGKVRTKTQPMREHINTVFAANIQLNGGGYYVTSAPMPPELYCRRRDLRDISYMLTAAGEALHKPFIAAADVATAAAILHRIMWAGEIRHKYI